MNENCSKQEQHGEDVLGDDISEARTVPALAGGKETIIKPQSISSSPDLAENSSPLGMKIEGMTRIKLGNGEIVYLESLVPDHDLWFSRLMNEVPLSPERVMLYGKERVLRRQTCNYGDNYDYNKLAKSAVPWHGPVLELKKMLEEKTGRVFTQCACNLYPDGETGIGLHHDKRHPLLVASVSFGSERTMGFAAKGGKLDTSLPMITLASGSLLLFTSEVNENFKHTIIEDKSVRGPRISVTFREFPAEVPPKSPKERASVAPQQKSPTIGLKPAPAGLFPGVDYSQHTDSQLHEVPHKDSRHHYRSDQG